MSFEIPTFLWVHIEENLILMGLLLPTRLSLVSVISHLLFFYLNVSCAHKHFFIWIQICNIWTINCLTLRITPVVDGISWSWSHGSWTTHAISVYHCSNPFHGKVYLIQHYVIKFVCDLRQVGSFPRVLRFSSTIKLTAKI